MSGLGVVAAIVQARMTLTRPLALLTTKQA
jgi:hypothetical protein